MTKTIPITCTGAATLPLGRLEPFQGTLKELSRGDYDRLRRSIEHHGFSFPVFVWRHGGKYYTLDGHQRVGVLKKMIEEGWVVPPVPVDWIEAKNEREAKQKLLLATSQYAKITGEGLHEFIELAGLKLDDLKEEIKLSDINLGFFEQEFYSDTLANKGADDLPDQAGKVLNKKWRVEAGDLWRVGEHRLFCGDCGEPKNLERLFGKERAILMNTDPPYGIAYDSRDGKPDGHKRKCAWEMVENDDKINENIQPFLERCFKALKDGALEKRAAWYLWHAHLTGAFFAAAAAAAAAAADVLLHRQIIWKKPRFILGRGLYHWSHEPCFMGWVRGSKPPFYGERNQTTVWEIDYDGKKNPVDRVHPTQKPVKLFEAPILNHTRKGEICCDPFAGSGSQVVAAELHHRRCYALEISPAYCAVILERMKKTFPGIKAEKI